MESSALLFFVLVFIFGTIIGSFLNVVIYRIGSGAGLGGRSRCLSCGRVLRARMLVPVWSYLFQKGRCAFCDAKISAQYVSVEIATGLLFVAAAWVNGFFVFPETLSAYVLFCFDALIWSTLLLVTVYDLRHKIIPDRLSALFALCAAITLFFKYHFGIFPEHYIPLFDAVPWWLDVAAAPLLAIPFAALWFFSGGRAMGLGDAKLAWGIGWFLGFAKGLSAVIFAFWIAFIPSIILLLLPKKSFTMKSEIPFAPFLILGTLLVYLCGADILSWSF